MEDSLDSKGIIYDWMNCEAWKLYFRLIQIDPLIKRRKE